MTIINQKGPARANRTFLDGGTEVAASEKSGAVSVPAAVFLGCLPAAACDKSDVFDDCLKMNDGAAHTTVIDAQQSLLSPTRGGFESCCEKETGLQYNSHSTRPCVLSQSRAQPHGVACTTNRTSQSLQESCALVLANITNDISPTLLTAISSCASEMMDMMQEEEQHALQEHNEDQTFSCRMIEYAKIRLFPSANISSSFGLTDHQGQQHSKMASVALLWFLRYHPKLAATMTSMAFSFIVGLERYGLSWKKAVEVPLAGLQLLARYAYVMSFEHVVNTFDAQRPREHLLVMAACLLASWKFAEVDATAAILVSILNRSFFGRHCVLNVRDVVWVEFIVLDACKLCVHVPCWWRLAVELVTELLIEEEEEAQSALVVDNNEPQQLLHTTGEVWEGKQGSEAKLEQLLLASERLLLFVMDALTVENGTAAGGGEKSALGGCRLRELRELLCRWMECHPLFGVALAVASGAVGLQWAVARVAPTGGGLAEEEKKDGLADHQRRVAPPAATCEADRAAQQDVRAMVPAVVEALNHVSAVKT